MCNVVGTQCCGVNEIYGINGHKTPEDCMVSIVQRYARSSYVGYSTKNPSGYSYDSKIISPIPGILTFTAHVGYKNAKVDTPDSLKYGPALAAYIQEMGLGPVTASETSFNRVNHPSHKIQHWAWVPDTDALQKWWADHNPNKVKEKKVEASKAQPRARNGRFASTDSIPF